MIHTAISDRDRQTLIIGVVVVALLLLLTRGLPALRAWSAVEVAHAATAAGELADGADAARRLPILRDTLVARRRTLASLDSVIIAAPSPAAAAAALASALAAMARDAHVRLGAMQLRADSLPTAGYARVGVRMNAVADARALADLLRAIDTDQPLLVVRELSVTQPDPSAPANRPDALRIDLRVECIARVP